MDRRDFLKTAGVGAAALGLAGCGQTDAQDKGISGTMEYRTDPKTGDKVSLLGYSCMRWQMTKDADATTSSTRRA